MITYKKNNFLQLITFRDENIQYQNSVFSVHKCPSNFTYLIASAIKWIRDKPSEGYVNVS